MNILQIVTQSNCSAAISLEELLLTLAKYGKPRLSQLDRGWYCAIEMHVTAAGVDFKVASDFTSATPTEAAAQCLDRTEKAISQL